MQIPCNLEGVEFALSCDLVASIKSRATSFTHHGYQLAICSRGAVVCCSSVYGMDAQQFSRALREADFGMSKLFTERFLAMDVDSGIEWTTYVEAF